VAQVPPSSKARRAKNGSLVLDGRGCVVSERRRLSLVLFFSPWVAVVPFAAAQNGPLRFTSALVVEFSPSAHRSPPGRACPYTSQPMASSALSFGPWLRRPSPSKTNDVSAFAWILLPSRTWPHLSSFEFSCSDEYTPRFFFFFCSLLSRQRSAITPFHYRENTLRLVATRAPRGQSGEFCLRSDRHRARPARLRRYCRRPHRNWGSFNLAQLASWPVVSRSRLNDVRHRPRLL